MYPRHVDEALKYSMATRNFRENLILGEYFESDFLRNAARQVVFIELTLFVFDAIMYIYEIHSGNTKGIKTSPLYFYTLRS